jgi:hypothetical protein
LITISQILAALKNKTFSGVVKRVRADSESFSGWPGSPQDNMRIQQQFHEDFPSKSWIVISALIPRQFLSDSREPLPPVL